MTNILTDFRGRIVSHSLHRATQLYAAMVQWLSIQVTLMLSHVNQYGVGSIPVEVSYFWPTCGNSLLFPYTLGWEVRING